MSTHVPHLHEQQRPPERVSGRRPDGSWRLPLSITATIDDPEAFAHLVRSRWASASARAQTAVLAHVAGACLADEWRIEYWQQGPHLRQGRALTLVLRVPPGAGDDLGALAEVARLALERWQPRDGIHSFTGALDTHWATR